MKFAWTLGAGLTVALSVTAADAQSRPGVLFIGNSFTYAHGSAVRFYRAGTVTVVMHGFSTLDYDKPRDPAKLIATAGQMAAFLRAWASDHYHASAHGSYLEGLVIFGSLTGRDPRSLGENECSGFELGFSRSQVRALRQVAFDQLASAGVVTPSPLVLPNPVNPVRCVHTH